MSNKGLNTFDILSIIISIIISLIVIFMTGFYIGQDELSKQIINKNYIIIKDKYYEIKIGNIIFNPNKIIKKEEK